MTNTICEVWVSMTLSVHTGYDNTQYMAQYLGLHAQANISMFINIGRYTFIYPYMDMINEGSDKRQNEHEYSTIN